MSVYKNTSPMGIKDSEGVRDYILRLNKEVQNIFSSVNPDDNFSLDALNHYLENEKQAALFELTAENLTSLITDKTTESTSLINQNAHEISLCVKQGELVSKLNLEPDNISISGERLNINMTNFKVVPNGDAYVRGTLTATAGNIAGWSISTSNGHHYWTGNQNTNISVNSITAEDGTADSVEAWGSVDINATFMGNFGTIYNDDAVFDGGFTASCIEGDSTMNVSGNVIVKKSYRDEGEPRYDPVEHPDEDYSFNYAPKNNGDDDENLNHYDLQYDHFGFIVNGLLSCYRYYSKLAGMTVSDRRLKKDIENIDIDNALTLLKMLVPKRYTLKTGGERTQGFIAQETPEKYRVTLRNGKLGLKYNSIMCTLDEVIKTMTERLEQYE